MKTRFFFALLAVASLNLSDVIYAAELKIAFVDEQAVMESSSAYKDIKSQLENKEKEYQNSANKMQEALQKKYEQVVSQQSTLSQESYAKKTGELQKEQSDAQNTVQMIRVSLEKAYMQSTQTVLKKLVAIIEKKAKDTGLSVVYNGAATFYKDPALDITKDIIAELNKALPHFQVKFEAVKNSTIAAKK